MTDDVRDDVSERPFGHAPGHARHDRLLVSRFAVGETDDIEAADARQLVATCSDCSRLADDIRLLRSSVAALPAPKRTRNFRLTTEQAERLRGNSLERLLRRLAMPGLGMLRPVAGVAVAMGLTIAVVGAGLPVAAPASVPTDRGGLEVVAGPTPPPAAMPSEAAPAVGATSAPGNDSGLESSGTTDYSSEDTTASGSGRSADETQRTGVVAPPDTLPQSPLTSDGSTDTTRLFLIYGGVTLATLSFAVLLLAWFARRRLEDPLLR